MAALASPISRSAFPTTYGFSSTSGFAVAAWAADSSCKALVCAELQQPEVQEQPKPLLEKVAPSPAPSVRPTPEMRDSSHAHVGFRGLLEISQNSGVSGVLGVTRTDDHPSSDVAVEITCTAHTDPTIRRLVKSVIRGLKACQEPEKALDGMGGTYFFLNESGKKAAILKPCDEEPLAPNNPKGYVGRELGAPGWKPTVRVGEAAMREVAAYLLDYDNWSRVPTSVLVRARHPVFCYNSMRAASGYDGTADLPSAASLCTMTSAASDDVQPPTPATPIAPGAGLLPMKLGSLQEFVQHECDTSEMGPSRFAARDVHRIGILDIRIFNTDRHAGNMLVRMPRASTVDLKNLSAPYELVPIDHGFCLPETLEAPYFEWLHWPQTLQPFTEDELQYIRDLDIQKDKGILRQNLPNLRPECVRVLEVSTLLLQACAAAGLNLFEIASVMTRPFIECDEEASELEKICVHAKQCALHKAEHPEADEDVVSEGEGEGGEGSLPLGSPSAGGFGTIREEEDMLFTLDDGDRSSASGGGGASCSCLGSSNAALALASPSPSPGSSLSSSSIDQLSLGGVSEETLLASASLPRVIGMGGVAGGLAGAASRLGVSGVGAAQAQPMARSLHIGNGMAFAWRRSKTQATVLASRASGKSLRPPPVVSFAPDSLNGFFSDFSDQLWADFVNELGREINEAVACGKWKQATQKDSTIAMSCPRF